MLLGCVVGGRRREWHMADSREPALVAEGLVRRFGPMTAVDGVSLSIPEGETYGLLGPNGAGKTTTISMICGLLEPDAGSVTVCGQKVTTRSTAAKGALGLAPQDIALYPDLSVNDNLRFFGKLQGLSGRELTKRMGEVLEVVGLADRAADKVETYSAGMKRRANIAVGMPQRSWSRTALSMRRSCCPTGWAPQARGNRCRSPSSGTPRDRWGPRWPRRLPTAWLGRLPPAGWSWPPPERSTSSSRDASISTP